MVRLANLDNATSDVIDPEAAPRRKISGKIRDEKAKVIFRDLVAEEDRRMAAAVYDTNTAQPFRRAVHVARETICKRHSIDDATLKDVMKRGDAGRWEPLE